MGWAVSGLPSHYMTSSAMRSRADFIDLLTGNCRGLILLHADCRVCEMNATARQILQDAAADLWIEAGRLHGSEEFALTQLVKRAANGRALFTSIHGSNGSRRRTPLYLLAAPTAVTGVCIRTSPAEVALILVDLDLQLRPNAELLRHTFGFTRRECAIATILMNGRGPNSIAAELQITTNTVRAHLKTLMSKTGTNRQGQLVRVLLSSPAMAVPADLAFGAESDRDVSPAGILGSFPS
jgi:DNA-binding CsgD family transcriptional regulator